MGKLTVKTIEAARFKGKPIKLSDGHGLYLHITGTARTWRYRYKISGRETIYTIGPQDLISLADARDRHRSARLAVLDGIDPVESRREVREKEAADQKATVDAAITFAAVKDQWMDKQSKIWAPATYKKNISRLNQVPQVFNEKAVVSITEDDIDEVLRDLQSRNKVDAAHRLKVLFTQIFDHAIGKNFKIITSNPAHHPSIELDKKPQYKNFNYPKSKRDIATILELSQNYNASMRSTWLGLQLLPYLAFRPSNVRRLRWEQVDFEDELIRIEAEEMKGRSPFVSPMPIQVVSLLKEQRKYTGQFNYVMPGKHSNQPLSDMVYTSAYRRMDVIELIHPHGWRHVFKTQVTEQGLFNRLEVEIQMAHKISGVEGVYVGTDLLPVRRKLMQSWADCLDGIKEKYRSGSNVVELVAN